MGPTKGPKAKKLTEEMKDAILKRYNESTLSRKELADEFKVSVTTIVRALVSRGVKTKIVPRLDRRDPRS